MAPPQAAENHRHKWGLIGYLQWGIYTSILTWVHSKNLLVATEASNLKVVSTIFLLVCVLNLNDSTCQITKNVFYFT